MITNLNFIDSGVKLFKAFTLIDNLFISIDAATKKTYEDIRKLADWSLLMRNLEKLGQFCAGQNIIARFAIQRKNISEIAKFVDFIHGFRFFNEIVFDPVNLNLVNENYASVAWNYDDLLLCKNKISLAYKKAEEYGLECKQYLTADSINRNEDLLLKRGYVYFLEGCLRDLYDKRFPENNPCNFLKSNLFVSPKKQVYPCSGAYRADELMIGDLNKNSLEEIWNSSLTGKLRGDLAGGARSGVCNHGCCTFEGQVNEV